MTGLKQSKVKRAVRFFAVTLTLILVVGMIASNTKLAAATTYTVTFEGTGETKTGYAGGSVTLSGINWWLENVLIGTSASDMKNGARSARFRAPVAGGAAYMEMEADKLGGAGTISLWYARSAFSGDRTPTAPTFVVEYSTDSGSSWTQAGSEVDLDGVDTLTQFSAAVNVEGDVRIRIRCTGGTAGRRFNIDDIEITDYGAETYTVTFVVKDVENSPIENARVTLGISVEYTDDDGIAVFDEIVAGDYGYEVRKLGYAPVGGTVTVDGDEEVEVILELIPGYFVDFEWPEETKTSYAGAPVTLSGISWYLENALIGTLDGDMKFGVKAARIRAPETDCVAYMEMQADKSGGAGTISLWYARSDFTADRDPTAPTFVVEYSTNGGSSWTQAGDQVDLDGVDTLTQFSAAVNVTGDVRIRIRCTGGTAGRRFNIDNILITDFIDNEPPEAPELVSPEDGAEIFDTTPTFTWTSVSDPSGVTYQIQIDDDDDFSSPVYSVIDLAETTYTVPDELELFVQYFWHVRAVDGANNVGDWSETWDFTVVPVGAMGVLLMPLLLLLPLLFVLRRQNRYHY